MTRIERVAELIKEEVSRIIREDVNDPRIGFVTITDAEVTPDLRLAKVYYTVYGDEDKRADTQKGLDSAKPFIRRELASAMSTKVTPQIRFIFDESIERGSRIESFFEQNADVSEDDD